MTGPQVGDYGLSVIGGLVGKLVWAGQALVGDLSRWTHAFIYVGDNKIVQAEPGGATCVELDQDLDVEWSQWELTPKERLNIRGLAMEAVGTPYSFLDYGSLLLHHLHMRPGFVERYIESSKHQICSQLVAWAYKYAGHDLFPGKANPLDVTPGDLARINRKERERRAALGTK